MLTELLDQSTPCDIVTSYHNHYDQGVIMSGSGALKYLSKKIITRIDLGLVRLVNNFQVPHMPFLCGGRLSSACKPSKDCINMASQ